MPKRLTIDPDLDQRSKGWVRALLRVEMAEKRITYRELVDLLREVGLEEREVNLRNKVTRGELSAATLLLCLKVMGTKSIDFSRLMFARVDPEELEYGLSDPLIQTVDREDETGFYTVRVGQLHTPVTIILRQRNENGRTAFFTSHAILTPGLNVPYRTRLNIEDSPGRALKRAIRALTTPYQLAVEAGHEPEESWLVPNDGRYDQGAVTIR